MLRQFQLIIYSLTETLQPDTYPYHTRQTFVASYNYLYEIIIQSRFRGYSARKNLSPSSSLTLFDPSKIAKKNPNADQGIVFDLIPILSYIFI